MDIVVKIDEELYYNIKGGKIYSSYIDVPYESVVAISNGTVLPKGHGDLVDKKDLLAESYAIDDWSGNNINVVDRTTVEAANVIVKADKINEEEELNSLGDYMYKGKALKEWVDIIERTHHEVVTRGNCMMCGKELTDGLFICKECGDKINRRK